MNKIIPLLLLFFSPLIPIMVQADVAVSDTILQQGVFSPPKCNDASGCLCEADIRYPAINNMQDFHKQELINTSIKKSAEQLACQGTPSRAANNGDNFSITHHYEITFQSPKILSFKFSDLAYEGGAHGNSSIEGMIIDVE